MGNSICNCKLQQDQLEKYLYSDQSKVNNSITYETSNSRILNKYNSRKTNLKSSNMNNDHVIVPSTSIFDKSVSIRQSMLFSEYLRGLNSTDDIMNRIDFIKVLYLQAAIKSFISRVKSKKTIKSDKYIYNNIVQLNFRKFGIQILINGDKYIGEFGVDNDYHGFGISRFKNGDSYFGEFKNSLINGYGRFELSNENLYEGLWIKDIQYDIGFEQWTDKSFYFGIYDQGSKSGIGTFNWIDGSSYKGEWKDNQLNGYGIYHFIDGREYLGEWHKNSMHGYGEFIWKDKKYIGFYENDQKSGFGIYLWTTPVVRLYIGFWKNGKQHGVGKYISNKLDNWGYWENGQRITWLNNKEEAKNKLNTKEEEKYLCVIEFDVNKILKIVN